MIIGKGLIAKAFLACDRDDTVFFASGVSNSTEKDTTAFSREEKMLSECLEKYHDKRFVYFSSCSINDKELNKTPYHQHKKRWKIPSL